MTLPANTGPRSFFKEASDKAFQRTGTRRLGYHRGPELAHNRRLDNGNTQRPSAHHVE